MMTEKFDHADPDGALALAVAEARKGVFTGIDVILIALRHEDDAVRRRAAACCQQMGFSTAIDQLVRMAGSDVEADNRAQAVYALGGIGRPIAIPAIVSALGDDEDSCREAARAVLFRMLGSLELMTLLGDEGDALDPRESQRVGEWWKDHAARFEPARVYAMGELATPAVFIAKLKESVITLPDAYLSQLRDWTGQDFGESPLRAVIRKWEDWWSSNEARFEPGTRYYFGRRIE